MMNDEALNRSKPDRNALTKDIQAFLETRVDIRFAYVFGSFLDEEHFRDIDLGVYIDETDALQNRLQLIRKREGSYRFREVEIGLSIPGNEVAQERHDVKRVEIIEPSERREGRF